MSEYYVVLLLPSEDDEAAVDAIMVQNYLKAFNFSSSYFETQDDRPFQFAVKTDVEIAPGWVATGIADQSGPELEWVLAFVRKSNASLMQIVSLFPFDLLYQYLGSTQQKNFRDLILDKQCDFYQWDENEKLSSGATMQKLNLHLCGSKASKSFKLTPEYLLIGGSKEEAEDELQQIENMIAKHTRSVISMLRVYSTAQCGKMRQKVLCNQAYKKNKALWQERLKVYEELDEQQQNEVSKDQDDQSKMTQTQNLERADSINGPATLKM